MLLSLAIADDIGAVVVIAAFYSGGLDWPLLALAACGFAGVYVLNRSGVRSVPIYVAVGVPIWLAVYKAGVHPTVAGVALGLMTPSGVWVGREALRLSLTDVVSQIEDENNDPAAGDLTLLAFAAKESVSPLERLEHGLHAWVGFAIMPLFALANAGVHIELNAITEPVSVAVALALLLGKPVGVVLFSAFAVRFGVAKLPDGVSWLALLGGGFLAGIGFTMSLFVAGLAFDGHPACSALIGAALLVLTLQRDTSPPS